MGLSASQARYLALQARQSNLEYQGQQINQERAILSQQTATLYNHLLELQVPVPPSTNDFTKVVYTGSDGNTPFTIGNITPTGETYTVNLEYNKTGHSLEQSGTVVVKEEIIDEESGETQTKIAGEPYYTLRGAHDNNLISDSTLEDYIEAVINAFPEEFVNMDPEQQKEQALDKVYVYFKAVGESSVKSAHFVRKEDVEAIKSGNISDIKNYEYIPNGTYTESKPVKDCKLTFDGAGRITAIDIPTGYDNDDAPIGWKTIKLSANTVTDTQAYNDAMAEYEYKQHLYDKEQQEINKKTEIIQIEDRNLELKLTRLDNERKEIDTEREAVDKVLKDNIEKTYKTFNG